MAGQSFSDCSVSVVTCGPTKAMLSWGLASFIAAARAQSPLNPGVLVKSTRNSYSLTNSMVCWAETWCGDASSRREPSGIPAGYGSQTGYQYDSVSRVASRRELARPSKPSHED